MNLESSLMQSFRPINGIKILIDTKWHNTRVEPCSLNVLMVDKFDTLERMVEIHNGILLECSPTVHTAVVATCWPRWDSGGEEGNWPP